MRLLYLVMATAAVSATAAADLFVSGFSNGTVYRYDETTGAVIGGGPFISGGGLSLPHRSILGDDGNLHVASAGNDQILRYDGTTGAFIDAFIAPGTKGLAVGVLDYPVDQAIGPDGNLYVSSQLNDSILRFDRVTGQFIDVFVPPGTGGLDGPSGIKFHAGDLFVAGRFSNEVYRFNGATGALMSVFVPGTAGLNQPFGIEFDGAGNLLVVSGSSNSVLRFDGVTGASLGAFVSSETGGLSLPIDLTFGPDGALYVASFNDSKVARFDGLSGASLGNFVPPGTGVEGANFVTFTVPEPGTFATLIFAGLALRSRRRQRREAFASRD